MFAFIQNDFVKACESFACVGDIYRYGLESYQIFEKRQQGLIGQNLNDFVPS